MPLLAVCSLSLLAALPVSAEAGFRAGAARVDITPPAGAGLPMAGYASRKEGSKGIRDNIYVRALVVHDGSTQAALVVWDLIGIPHALAASLAERIERELGIPRDRVMLAGTHTHAAPDPRASAEYAAKASDHAVEAVRRAQAALQPARVGFGTGRANVCVNRRARFADGTWWLGVNPDGPSDKTVAVVKFETAGGRPIAIFSNYGCHGTVGGPQNYQVGGDLPGAAARFVETRYGNGVVAPWTSGAAGDQNPIYTASDGARVDALGMLLGEEIVRVAESIRTSPGGKVRAAQKSVMCPGRKLAPGYERRGTKHELVDGEPVEIRLSLLRIGDIALAGVSGEVLTMVGQRLRKRSPLPATVMITHCNGSSGYLPDDAAYEHVSYEIAVAKVKPGCAEKAIVDGVTELIAR